MPKFLALAILTSILWQSAAGSQEDQIDTVRQSSQRSSIALAVGANFWEQYPGHPGGAGTISIQFGLWRRLWGQVDLGLWTQGGYRPLFRFGLAVQHKIPITTDFSIFPKAGGSLVFSPLLFWSVGCGVSYQCSRKLDVFLEAGEHIAHRESQIRANYYPLATYLSVGLIIRGVR